MARRTGGADQHFRLRQHGTIHRRARQVLRLRRGGFFAIVARSFAQSASCSGLPLWGRWQPAGLTDEVIIAHTLLRGHRLGALVSALLRHPFFLRISRFTRDSTVISQACPEERFLRQAFGFPLGGGKSAGADGLGARIRAFSAAHGQRRTQRIVMCSVLIFV